ncbi:MAG: hypothetical protein SFX74_06040, partial [Fimbriimonadaceae bacterium]|nr:hypothetical protein [Fimbriimonadaceae bacterium]
AFFKKYGIQDSARIILRVARIGPHYYESVLDGMRMAESLHQRGLDVCFVHIGYADVPSLADEVYAFAKTVNDRAGKVIAVSASDESQVALKYFAMASVVVGTGRSAFEGMSLGKPTMIVGKLGFAGPVDPDHLPAQAQYNYSGRNADGSQTKEAYQAEYDETMYRVLSDPHYAAQLGQYAFDHVLNTLDVSISVPIYEARYRAYRTEWMSTPSELRRASMYSWIKRGLRNMMSKSFRAQVSSMINLRQKKAA